MLCPIVCHCNAWDACSHTHPISTWLLLPPSHAQVEYENGRVEEFLPGDNLSHETLRQPDVSAAIASAMARFHVCMLAGLVSLTVAQKAQQAQQQQAGAANGLAERQRQTEQQLRPAIFERILKWYAAAVECGADLQAAGLAALPQEVRGACTEVWGLRRLCTATAASIVCRTSELQQSAGAQQLLLPPISCTAAVARLTAILTCILRLPPTAHRSWM